MATPPTSLVLPRTLARAFSALARDLTYPSESDYPYEPFAAPFPRDSPLRAEEFRDAARIGRRYEIRVDSAEAFFERRIHPVDGYDDSVPKYVLLKKVMEATLSELSLIRVGGEDVVRVRVYLIGRMDVGDLSGLSSVSIET